MDVAASFELTRDELRRANKAVAGGLWAMMWRAVVFFTVGGIAFLFGVPVLGVLFLLAAFAIAFVTVRAPRIAVKTQADRLCVPCTIRINDEGYELQRAQDFHRYQWSMFQRIQTTEEFWLLYLNKRSAVIVPRRAFEARQQAEIDHLLTNVRSSTAV
jgi:hypothetical protein